MSEPPPYVSSVSPADRFLRLVELDDLAHLLGVSPGAFNRLYAASLYTEFSLPKRSGGVRTIRKPAPDLMRMQWKLSRILNALYRPRESEHGFLRARNIVTNAQPHVRRRYVFNVDLSDFFPSINFGRVRGLFMAPPFRLPSNVATVVAAICTSNNELPQGAPSSPIVSNLIAGAMDRALERLAHKHRCRYTRYADDLTFSTNRPKFPEAIGRLGEFGAEVGSELRAVIEGSGFRVNARKVRLSERGQRQEVTCIIVNRELRVPWAFISHVRAMLRAWERFGLPAAQHEYAAKYFRRPWKDEVPDFQKVVRGKIAHIGFVRTPSDALYLELASKFAGLAGTEPPPMPEKPAPPAVAAIGPALWVLESNRRLRQGTGFALAGVGILTCDHVLGDDSVLFRAEETNDPRPYKVVFRDDKLDVALLRLGDPLGLGDPLVGELVMSPSPDLQQTDPILVARFPNFAWGDSFSLFEGAVSGFRMTQAGHRRILLNARVVAGMSGGPVVDSKFRVVGMAVTGAERDRDVDDTEKHGAIPIELILKRVAEEAME